jgi:nitrous oxide reductase accessory protein NosL
MIVIKYYIKGDYMRKIGDIIAAALLLSALAVSAGAMGGKMKMYQSVDPAEAKLMQQGQSKEYCPNCGMYLPKFYKTNHAVRLDNGEVRQYCSIYCLVEEMELTHLRDKKDKVDEVMVVDAKSLEFINAKDAYYVVGSKKPGTMTTTSKYAFADKDDAVSFAAKNGGEVTDYKGAYTSALKDFAKDTAYVYNKRSSKMYKMGKKLYNSKCDKKQMEKLDAHTMGDMKALIKEKNVCGKLNDMKLQGIMLYWWDVRMDKFEKLHGKNQEVQKYIKQYKNK